MAKLKTYSTNDMVRALGGQQVKVLKTLKANGIKPTNEVKVGKMTYRQFDQAAMDWAVAYRKEQDTPALAPEVAPVEKIPTPFDDLVVSKKLGELFDAVRLQHKDNDKQWRDHTNQLDNLRTEVQTGMRYLNDKLDQVLAQVRALNTEMGVSSAVLNGVAHAPTDDA
mgnify:FL=1